MRWIHFLVKRSEIVKNLSFDTWLWRRKHGSSRQHFVLESSFQVGLFLVLIACPTIKQIPIFADKLSMKLALINLFLVCTVCLLLVVRPGDAKVRGSVSRGSSRGYSVPKSSYKKAAVVPTYHYATTRHHGNGNRNDRGDQENNDCTFYQKYILRRQNCKKTIWFMRNGIVFSLLEQP